LVASERFDAIRSGGRRPVVDANEFDAFAARALGERRQRRLGRVPIGDFVEPDLDPTGTEEGRGADKFPEPVGLALSGKRVAAVEPGRDREGCGLVAAGGELGFEVSEVFWRGAFEVGGVDDDRFDLGRATAAERRFDPILDCVVLMFRYMY